MNSVPTDGFVVRSEVCSHTEGYQKAPGSVKTHLQNPTTPATNKSNSRSSRGRSMNSRDARTKLPEDVQIRSRSFLDKLATNAVNKRFSSEDDGLLDISDFKMAAIRDKARQDHQVQLPAKTEVKGLRPGLLSL